tara:strand:+ start:452 stop:571 length:120 start_codon:yes stop_codon:yes gene_type:complete
MVFQSVGLKFITNFHIDRLSSIWQSGNTLLAKTFFKDYV